MADVLAVLLVAAVLLVLVAAVAVVRGTLAARRPAGRERWWVDAEPTSDGATRVLLRRGPESSLFRELDASAEEADVQDAIAQAEVRADTLNARSAPLGA